MMGQIVECMCGTLKATCLDRPDDAHGGGHEYDQDPDEPGELEVVAALEYVTDAVKGTRLAVAQCRLLQGMPQSLFRLLKIYVIIDILN